MTTLVQLQPTAQSKGPDPKPNAAALKAVRPCAPNDAGSHVHGRSNGNDCDSLEALFERQSFDQHFQPNSTILLQGEPADAVYHVKSGTVRCCLIDADGKRQIFSFVGKGGFVGISDVERWHFTAEAVDHVILQSVPRATLEQNLATNLSLRQDIRTRVRTLLECRERQLLSLVSTKASERVLRFLIEFAETRPRSSHVVLPMCRRDIADHLGLSVETVSRAFGELKSKGLIDLATHEKYKIMHAARP